jgi:ATP-dependent Clp protease ATP-binding subunit ClpA
MSTGQAEKGAGMFERFSDRARQVVVLAQEEARALGHDYIGTEHLLLGLVSDGEGPAAHVLASLEITVVAVREKVEEVVGRGQGTPSGHLPFTPGAKRSLQLALSEALQLSDDYIGTEHLLLGLIREAEGPAALVLTGFGADYGRVRTQVTAMLQERRREREAAPAAGLADQADRASAAIQSQVLPRVLPQVLSRLDSIEGRLAALERRVGAVPDTSDLDERIAQVRADKESAIDAQDFETAAALRGTEKKLLAQRASRQREWASKHADVPSLTVELERLRDLLRQHGIEPEDGVA